MDLKNNIFVRLKGNKIYKLPGSYTIEMSLIMPLVIGIIWMLIYLSFYLYDCSYIEKNISRILLNDNGINICENTLGNWSCTYDYYENESKKGINVAAYMDNNARKVLPILNEALWKYSNSSSVSIINERQYILQNGK